MYKGKIVFVTGAANGLGNAIAKEYAKLNAFVIAIDIVDTKFHENNIDFYKADLKSEDQIKNVFKDVVKKYGSVHVLINNGAISKFNKSIFDIELSEFDEVIAVNLRGSFICSKEFIKANKGEDYGRIINIASTRFNQNEAGWEAYGASKGGLVSLTNTMAVSLSETPVTVNAISPGWIKVDDYELSDLDKKQHPSGRVGTPKDIVNACLFLTSKDNDFINGTNLIIDGGMTKKMIYMDDKWNL
ncbi:SDR family NAD(P)-dependent oxidoreductase [Romboutsia lituseburensis]|uniref:SDR family NAD(P)-dependent oxidoreductase n=1 Tax=Romboutsia lituseburensis TaxID=1537 RepID=UPI00215AD803|nr:SDR family oxidoreductase [Romboutsia lituseburensis]MCR8743793.1 SDR family oxidoreductase [Romboutsia lituseburensis]